MTSSSTDRIRTDTDCLSRQELLDNLFAGRDPLDEAQFWERGFKNRGVDFDTFRRVIQILGDILEVDLHRIRARDDFSKELSFFWDFDSLADLKIVYALEQEFRITISDAEAEAMKTLRDIIVGVHGKVIARGTQVPHVGSGGYGVGGRAKQ